MQEKREIVRTSDSLSLGHFLGEPSLVSPATRGGGLIFTTGYVAMNPDTGKPETGSIEVETRRTLDNLKMVLETAGSSFDKVLKINIFMEDLNEWPAMNEVMRNTFDHFLNVPIPVTKSESHRFPISAGNQKSA